MGSGSGSPARLGVLIALLTVCMADASASPQERAQLRAERHQLSEAFAQEERACSQQFWVTACLDDARARRREALAPVRERELRLDEAERQAKAEQRRQAISAKQALAASQPAARLAPPVRVRSAAAASSTPGREPQPAETADRAASAAARARLLEANRQGAVQAQRRVDKREADRLAGGRKAAPLPTPALPAASGSAR